MQYENLAPGSRVPQSNTYECVFCGQNGIASVAASVLPEPQRSNFDALSRIATKKFFHKDTFFDECPHCGKGTGWRLCEDAASSSDKPDAEGVSQRDEEDTAEQIQRALKTKDVSTLTHLGSRAVESLMAVFHKPKDGSTGYGPEERMVAAEALGIIGDKRAIPLLVGVIEEDTQYFVIAPGGWFKPALRALGQMGDKEAANTLAAFLADSRRSISAGSRQAMLEAIEAIKART